MQIGNAEFDFNHHTYVMGILNVTPDSFSDGGKWNSEDSALKHVEDMIAQGAAIIDVGGESTRPGFVQVSEEEEIHRTAPIIEKIKRTFGIPVSIDTWKATVAGAAIDAGADLINDVTGLFGDAQMGRVIAERKVPCCLMHNGQYITHAQNGMQRYMDLLCEDMQQILNKAQEAGIAKEKMILDPGVGFGKTQEENAEILANLGDLQTLGYSLLLGTSRKSVIGYLLDLPVDQRVEGTLVTSMLAAQAGYDFVRVHDVRENYRVIQMVEALRKWTR